MSKRGTQTSRLKNVIQVLLLGNKSGILTVTANQAAIAEEGRIVFIRGSITDVRLGKIVGQRALHALLQWGTCYFVFTEVETNTEPKQFSLSPSPDTGPLPQTTPSPMPDVHYIKRPLDYEQSTKGARQISPTGPPPAMTSHVAPVRLRGDAESLQRLSHARWSRAHMHLFLFVNGERTIQDLARLLQRSETEVERLLFDLKRAGIVHY